LVRTYQIALEGGRAPAWRRLLVDGAEDWLSGRMVQASARLDSLGPWLPRAAREPSFCADFAIAQRAVRALQPALVARARDAVAWAGRVCEGLD
jgi:hypothetical protein